MDPHQPPADPGPDATGPTRLEATTPASPPGPMWPAPGPVVGEPLGRFPVRAELGRGGMGLVLQVEDPELQRTVAAKVVLAGAGPAAQGKFLREARITGQLEHPNIVPVYELGRTQAGDPFYTMKQVRGRTLRALLEAEDAPGLVALLQVFLKACDGVALAHARGVIHRDLKPDNVMVGEYGEVLVLDWGLAKVTGDPDVTQGGLPAREGTRPVTRDGQADDESRAVPATVDGAVVGTLIYMAPEQARGEIDRLDARCDVYALGAILYQILARVPPFEGTVTEVLLAVGGGRLSPPSERAPEQRIPWELEAVVMRAMAFAPAERYPSVEALQEDIVAFLEGRALAAAEYTTLQRVQMWARRNRAAVASGLLALLAAAVSLVLAFVGITGERDVARRAQALAETERDNAVRAEGEARTQALRASASEARARAAAERAAASKAEAEANLARFLQMADVNLLGELGVEDDRLWLRDPTESRRAALVARLDGWLKQARALVTRRPGHLRDLEALRKRGRQDGKRWRFELNADRWRHAILARLAAGTAGLERALPGVQARRDAYAALAARTLAAPRQAWSRAIAEIADPAVCPAYRGLKIVPQLGLIPLGRDPASGLHEFVLALSGETPVRDAQGRLQAGDQTGIVLVLLPAGTFWQGARRPRPGEPASGPNIDPLADATEAPVTELRMGAVFVGKTEVTQAQWRRMTGRAISLVRRGPRYPVNGVRWQEAVDALARVGLRLPSEAQWEYANRAGTRTIWWTGDDPRSLAGAANLADRRYAQASRRQANAGRVQAEEWLDDGHSAHAPVGSYRANPFGLHDTLGNVWEWCLEPWVPAYYRFRVLEDGRGTRRLDQGGKNYVGGLGNRVARGASMARTARWARSSARMRVPGTFQTPFMGVRAWRRLYPER